MTVHQFPLFDIPRDPDPDRHVQEAISVTLRVDATDQWLQVPVRTVFTADGITGWSLEIGPYSVTGKDACALANALIRYGQMSGEFKPNGRPMSSQPQGKGGSSL